jgi:hypothetical protein
MSKEDAPVVMQKYLENLMFLAKQLPNSKEKSEFLGKSISLAIKKMIINEPSSIIEFVQASPNTSASSTPNITPIKKSKKRVSFADQTDFQPTSLDFDSEDEQDSIEQTNTIYIVQNDISQSSESVVMTSSDPPSPQVKQPQAPSAEIAPDLYDIKEIKAALENLERQLQVTTATQSALLKQIMQSQIQIDQKIRASSSGSWFSTTLLVAWPVAVLGAYHFLFQKRPKTFM